MLTVERDGRGPAGQVRKSGCGGTRGVDGGSTRNRRVTDARAADSDVASVSIFFPCYNDAATIGGLIERAAATIDALGDRRRDRRRERRLDRRFGRRPRPQPGEPRLRVVTHERNRGYGAALQSGFAAADREWVFYTDGDGQYDPGELAQLVACANDDVDVVQGYKLERSDNVARRVIGRMYHHFVSFFFGLRIRDTDCDFRLIRSSVLEDDRAHGDERRDLRRTRSQAPRCRRADRRSRRAPLSPCQWHVDVLQTPQRHAHLA